MSSMNPVVHFEMPYENRDRVARFYQSAFGWKMQMLGDDMGNYVVVTTTESDAKPGAPAGAIGGGFHPKCPDGMNSHHPSVVIGVPDVRASMAKIREAGGEVLGEPMMIPGVGEYVAFRDTEGNRNSIIQPLPESMG